LKNSTKSKAKTPVFDAAPKLQTGCQRLSTVSVSTVP
jgi:hypothetical protein